MLKIIIIVLLFFSYSFGQSITIAVSANVQYAIDELIKKFKEKNGDIQIKKVISSSGKLANQTLKGAPYDIFLSADMKYPLFLFKRGLALSKPKVYAYGIIVLWSMKDINIEKEGLGVLLKVNKIAVPNPKNAPYGKASIEILKNTKLYEKVKERIIYGESVSQVNHYILKRLVDVGFTSKSSVLSPVLRGKGKWVEIEKRLYSPIEQGAVLLKNAEGNEYAKSFFSFLFSKDAKQILKKYGYMVLEDEQVERKDKAH